MRNYGHENIGDDGSEISEAETYIINDDRNVDVSNETPEFDFNTCITIVPR